MNFSQEDIKQMVSECVKKILSEGISNITYHFTSLESCIDILKLNSFNLTMSSNKSDTYDNKKLFYLSTQRSRNKELGYAGHLGSCVRIQLDGKKIMEKYNVPIERVIRHYDVSGKLCPGIIGWNNELIYTTDDKTTKKYSDSSKWLDFKKLLQK